MMQDDDNNTVIDLGRPRGTTNQPPEEKRRSFARRGYIGISENDIQRRLVRFAAVGDVHGQFSLLSNKLEDCNQQYGISFVLQVGDIECHRDDDDLRSMAAPAKKRTLGDFIKACHRDEFYLNHPMYFIGGNHECYGWLDSERHFGRPASEDIAPLQQEAFLEVAPNVFYLGRAGYLPLRFYARGEGCNAEEHNADLEIAGMMQLAFLSGIHRPQEYYHRRPAMTDENLRKESNKRWIGFNIYDVQLLLEDEEDDGIDHEQPIDVETDKSSERLMIALALALGLDLKSEGKPFQGDVVLSSADVKYLARLLTVAGPGADADELERKRRDAAAELPRTLDSIVKLLCKGRSNSDIDKLIEHRLRRRRAVDLLMTHDWPSCVAEGNKTSVVGARSRPVGNDICREVANSLKPKVHCCGHMHRGYRCEIQHKTPSGKPSKKTTELCCLGKVGVSGPAAIAVFELDLETGSIIELGKDPELSRLGDLNGSDSDVEDY